MTDIQNLTDKQINEAMQSFPNSMILLDKKGKRNLIDYVNDDGFCLRIVKENKLLIDYNKIGATVTGFEFTVEPRGLDIESKDKNLNRAILLTYLKLKGWTND